MSGTFEVGAEDWLFLTAAGVPFVACALLALAALIAQLGRVLGFWLPSAFRWSRLDMFLVKHHAKRYRFKAAWDHPGWPPTELDVQALEEASIAYPSDWRILVVLAALLLDKGRMAAALRAAERMCELRPKDVRSWHALAWVLLRLTAAAVSDNELKAIGKESGPKAVFDITAHRKAAERELAILHLSAADAARRAVAVLNKCLAFWPDSESRDRIWKGIGIATYRFPELVGEKNGRPWVEGLEMGRRPWHSFVSELARGSEAFRA
jgi:hypothetical protein